MDADRDELRLRTGELVEKALQGDAEAIAFLYQLYETRLSAAAHRRLGRTLHGLMDSRDLVQSLWGDILDRLDHFEDRGPDSFFRWLHTCLIHKIHAKRRYHVAQRRDAHRLAAVPELDGLSRGSCDPTPSQQAMGDESAERLELGLQRLPPDQRQVLVLKLGEGLTHEQIARRVGKSTEAVKKSYSRGLRRLEAQLAPETYLG